MEEDFIDVEDADHAILVAARCGDLGVLEEAISAQGNVNFVDENGNSALHFAAANGFVDIMVCLVNNGAVYRENASGNSILHWALQNGQFEAASYIFSSFTSSIDVLHQNSFGRCVLTEAYSCNNEAIISLCLNHTSSTEDKLISSCIDDEDESSEPTVVHNFVICAGSEPLHIRECRISSNDEVISDVMDKTGLVVWPVSIILTRFMLTSSSSSSSIRQTDRILEVGSGCGLLGLSLARRFHCHVTLSDYFEATLSNLALNIESNNMTTSCQSLKLDWHDTLTWPAEGSFEYVIGCEVIYNNVNSSQQLSKLAKHALTDGGVFVLTVADEERAGLDDLVANVTSNGFSLDRQVELGGQESDWENFLAGDEDGELMFKYFTEFTTRPKSTYYEFRKVANNDTA